MRKLGKIVAAYVVATVAVVIAAWVGALFIADVWRVQFSVGLFIAATWLVIVGLPTVFVSAGYLLRQLGARVRPTAWLSQAGSTLIPVGTAATFAYTVPAVMHQNGQHHIEVKELEIRAGDYVIPHQVLLSFLRTAWAKQRQGDDGLSRTYWVEKGRQLERGEYEAIIQVLTREGLIRGRKHGRSGKLVMPPASTLYHLEERV